MSTAKRICPICEAACGLTVELNDDVIVSVKANDADTFSQGHSCAKGIALEELHEDPDRLRSPLIRNAQGDLVGASWAAAFARIDSELQRVREHWGDNAVATYLGNPTAHNIGLAMGAGVFLGALKSTAIFSAGSVDQLPKQLASELMFGNGMAIPVPDIERTELLVIIGANPIVSNGSLWVVPGIRDKLRALRERGGRCVVIDPRRTETARIATAHHFIRPGTDAWLLAALCNELLALGCEPEHQSSGFLKLVDALKPISRAVAAARTGLAAEAIQALARDLASAKSACVYGRVGTTLQRFGTLTSFLMEVVNLLTHNLDNAGGAMFPQQAFAEPRPKTAELAYARYRSRVSSYPEVLGQLPVACLAEEMETAGPGQIRALVSLAGNPVVSNPDSERLQRALESLDFMVAVDIYHNDTTRLADVVLPGTSPFEECHYDSFLGAMTYKNTARYSCALVPRGNGMDEWRILLQLAHIADGEGVASDVALDVYEDALVEKSAAAYLALREDQATLPSLQAVMSALGQHRGVDRLLDLGIRFGPWGDGFSGAEGLSLQRLIDTPDGVDMGPLQPRLLEVMQHPDGMLQLAPEVVLEDLQRLAAEPKQTDLLLIGRRHPNTNNSWLHNLPMLNRGRDRAVLEMHPQDASVRQIAEGDQVRLRSVVGELTVRVALTEDLMPGTLSLPHGYSNSADLEQQIARSGPNSNVLAPADYVDVPSATAALNGIPVEVSPV